ncbi:MAG TPA: hypothetical protein VMV21_07970 [Vicinamibacteria bacterium]|nr:hypothetical protein [Vicinamibacteria bacterium]
MLRALRRSTATAAFLLALIGAGTLLTVVHAWGLPTLPLVVGLLSGGGLVLGLEAWRRQRRAARAALRGRRRASTAPTTSHRYDLAKDRTTDSQRWLM